MCTGVVCTTSPQPVTRSDSELRWTMSTFVILLDTSHLPPPVSLLLAVLSAGASASKNFAPRRYVRIWSAHVTLCGEHKTRNDLTTSFMQAAVAAADLPGTAGVPGCTTAPPGGAIAGDTGADNADWSRGRPVRHCVVPVVLWPVRGAVDLHGCGRGTCVLRSDVRG